MVQKPKVLEVRQQAESCLTRPFGRDHDGYHGDRRFECCANILFQVHAESIEIRSEEYLMLDHWNNFFLMVGGGAAALAGLIFVAMSINPESIIRDSTHKNRAINMLTGFSAIFMACSLALLGDQYLVALGFEWLFLWVIATVIFIRGYVIAIIAGMSSIGLSTPRLAGGTMCYFAEVIGAIFLILGNSAGLFIAAIATIVLFAFLISGAWLLIIGIYQDPTKR